ncbi:unnamed protein product [Phytomonas sp. EM1]|nr:unnamed protein product [Phytomonas sp. EM1]|eukprot:CCW59817.1 unnamed protein product [Phytomonas sp. isolate EM1]
MINCGGAWVDEVKALTPENALDAVPAAFEGFFVHSYLVAPRAAIRAIPRAPPREESASSSSSSSSSPATPPAVSSAWYATLCEKWNPPNGPNDVGGERWLPAFQITTPRYSFSPVMVLPWYDRTVLLGPSITRLPGLPSRFPRSSSSSSSKSSAWLSSSELVVHSTDNYRQQLRHISGALAEAGIAVEPARILSCVSTIVPILKPPSAVPWAKDLLDQGYHISTFQRRPSPAPTTAMEGETGGGESNAGEGGFRPPFVHVYGGSPLLARRIAEEAVDAFLHHTSAIPASIRQTLQRCRTKQLRLLSEEARIASEGPAKSGGDSSSNPPPRCGFFENGHPPARETAGDGGSVVLWVKGLARSGGVEHLSDLVLRRAHVGYTSPAEALRALPFLASLLRAELKWGAEREKEEIELARTLIESVAVRTSPKETPG